MDRISVFEKYWQQNEERINGLPEQPIQVTLPDGTVKSGIAFKTSPMDIAMQISKGLADSIIISKVVYSSRLEESSIVACDKDDEDATTAASTDSSHDGELWDLNRPLIGNCVMRLLKYDDPESKTVGRVITSSCLHSSVTDIQPFDRYFLTLPLTSLARRWRPCTEPI